MGVLILVLWAAAITLGFYGFGLSGLLGSLFPAPVDSDAVISAIAAWVLLLGPPTLALRLRARNMGES
jgi:hypothetical protein